MTNKNVAVSWAGALEKPFFFSEYAFLFHTPKTAKNLRFQAVLGYLPKVF